MTTTTATNPQPLSPTGHFILGGLSGSLGRLLVNGFSVVKITSQVGAPAGRMGTYKGIELIYNAYGVRGFTRGWLAATLRSAGYWSINYTVFERLSSAYITNKYYYEWPMFDTLCYTAVAGGISGVAATLVTHPLDVLKVRQVIQAPDSPHYRNPLSGLIKIVEQEGLYRGAYRGFGLSVIGSGFYSGELFARLEFISNVPWVKHQRPFVPLEGFIYLCYAFGLTSAMAYPIDVVRRKFMAQSFVLPKEGHVDVQFRTVFQCVKEIYKINGVFGFFHGMGANLCKLIPQTAVFALVYLRYARPTEQVNITKRPTW